jgi:putative transposase
MYRPGPVTGADDLAMMRRIDELHLRWPFYGSRRMVFELNQAGHGVNRKALVPRPGTSKAAPGHKIHPYLLRGVSITEPNHVWASDITYIPIPTAASLPTKPRPWRRVSILLGKS